MICRRAIITLQAYISQYSGRIFIPRAFTERFKSWIPINDVTLYLFSLVLILSTSCCTLIFTRTMLEISVQGNAQNIIHFYKSLELII